MRYLRQAVLVGAATLVLLTGCAQSGGQSSEPGATNQYPNMTTNYRRGGFAGKGGR
ncbi:MAG: hypothetical protein QNJ67_01550 [Kiloniellales bacterium]|nr:hypothetical protein [Kiloniellales bacterium]